jgi:hypothetical protein
MHDWQHKDYALALVAHRHLCMRGAMNQWAVLFCASAIFFFFFAKVRNILLVRGLEASALHAYTRIQSVFMALLLAGAALLQATLSPTKLVLIRI